MKRFLKRALALTTVVVCSFGLLTGCGSNANAKTGDSKKTIVTDSYAAYDFVLNILGDNASDYEVVYLLDTGVDLHSFQPSVAQMATISMADMFIFVGGESDEWAVDAVSEAKNSGLVAINMMDVLEDYIKEEEAVNEVDTEEDDHDHDEEEEEVEYDEHVWLSIKNAIRLVEAISDGIEKIDSENSSRYSDNADAYVAKLTTLDESFEAVVHASDTDVVVFGDRFPFRYFTDDYDLTYYAAFVGCSAETEASFEVIVYLAQKVDEYDLDYIFVIENADESIAETIISNTQNKNVQILTFNSLQSVSSSDISGGLTYISAMESNLANLKLALGVTE